MLNKLGELITSAWNWVKGAPPSPAPDLRPDPDDKTAYDHVSLVIQSFDDHGEVFQVLPGGKQPTDVSKSVADLKSYPVTPDGYETWVDVYDGPKGNGFVVNYQKGSYVKRVNFGPEEWREMDWTEVKPVVIK